MNYSCLLKNGLDLYVSLARTVSYKMKNIISFLGINVYLYLFF